MRERSGRIMLFAVAAALITLVFDGMLQALQQSASIRGSVIDAVTAKPVEAVVLLINRNPPSEIRTRTVTTHNGVFEFDRLLDGNATVVVRADGSAPATTTVTLARTRAAITILVQRAASIRGTVVGPDGTPSAGAKVVPVYSESVPGKRILEELAGGRFDTREDGVFFLRNLVPGVPIDLRAFDAKGRRVSTRVILEPGEQVAGLRVQFVRP